MSRILHPHALPARLIIARASAGIFAALLAVTVAACGSTSPQASASAVLGSSLQQDCTSVADVLSDGPDPDADSVGYAQAQVLPLRQLTITDPALRRDVAALANAYEEFSSGSGAGGASGASGAAAAAAVAKAENAVNSICPQAAP